MPARDDWSRGQDRNDKAIGRAIQFPLGDSPIPDVDTDDWTPEKLVGTHPHLVTEATLSELQLLCDRTLSVVGAEGFDKRLLNRFTGDYVSIKRSETFTVSTHGAYISPHMHVRTALELYPILEELLDD